MPLAGRSRRAISAYRAGTELFLGVGSSAGQPSSRKLGSDYPLVDGQLFAFDLRDGRLMWPGPAVLEWRGLAVTQPADIPVLVFVDQMIKGEATVAAPNYGCCASIARRARRSIATTICRPRPAGMFAFAPTRGEIRLG